MKKTITLLLTFMTVVCLAVSCGSGGDGQSKENEKKTAESDLTVEDFAEKTYDEAEAYFGTPDDYNNSDNFGRELIYNDRYSLYGYKIRSMTYHEAGHQFSFTVADQSPNKNLRLRFQNLCDKIEYEDNVVIYYFGKIIIYTAPEIGDVYSLYVVNYVQ